MDCTLQPWAQINASFLKLLWSSIVTQQGKQLIHRPSFLWPASTPCLSINEQYSFVCTCQASSTSQSTDIDLGWFHFCCYGQWLCEHTYTSFAQTCLSAFEFVPSREIAGHFVLSIWGTVRPFSIAPKCVLRFVMVLVPFCLSSSCFLWVIVPLYWVILKAQPTAHIYVFCSWYSIVLEQSHS